MKKLTPYTLSLSIGIIVGSLFMHFRNKNQREHTIVNVSESKVFINNALMVIDEKSIVHIILPKTEEKDLRIIHDAMFDTKQPFQYPKNKKGMCVSTYKLTEYFFETN